MDGLVIIVFRNVPSAETMQNVITWMEYVTAVRHLVGRVRSVKKVKQLIYKLHFVSPEGTDRIYEG